MKSLWLCLKLKGESRISFYALGGSSKKIVCLCVRSSAYVTSADFPADVFALAVVTLAVFSVDAAVPRWVTGTLPTQALT